MSKLDELREEYNKKYGDYWDREYDLTLDEAAEWILACYDYYENECEKKDVYGGPYSDMEEKWYGHPFEIVSRISLDDPDYDWPPLPMWTIRITDMEDDSEDPGLFAAYPEELFWDPTEQR